MVKKIKICKKFFLYFCARITLINQQIKSQTMRNAHFRFVTANFYILTALKNSCLIEMPRYGLKYLTYQPLRNFFAILESESDKAHVLRIKKRSKIAKNLSGSSNVGKKVYPIFVHIITVFRLYMHLPRNRHGVHLN